MKLENYDYTVFTPTQLNEMRNYFCNQVSYIERELDNRKMRATVELKNRLLAVFHDAEVQGLSISLDCDGSEMAFMPSTGDHADDVSINVYN